MAERRMFAKTITTSDSFMDLPLSSQALYFHLGMHADDDGFVNSPKMIQRMLGCADDDLRLLVAKKFIIPFESGVVVIKHWKMNNYIRSDRYKPTVYQEEKELLSLKENGAYTLGIPDDNQRYTQYRLGKDSIDNSSSYRAVDFNELLTIDEVQRLANIYANVNELIDEVQASVNKRQVIIDKPYEYIIGYATNKGWQEK